MGLSSMKMLTGGERRCAMPSPLTLIVAPEHVFCNPLRIKIHLKHDDTPYPANFPAMMFAIVAPSASCAAIATVVRVRSNGDAIGARS
jgi:hypothetical protein